MKAEFVALSRIRRLDICLLAPVVVPLNEDINGSGVINGIVVLIAVDALGAAAFIRSADGQRAAVTAESNAMSFQRSAITKVVIHLGVRSFDVGDLF